MKRVVMFDTSIGSLNQGDEIINISIKNNWYDFYMKNYIIKLPSHTPCYSKLQSIIYHKKLDVIKNADYKFLCGTNALYTNMLRPLPSWNINLFNTELIKNTVCLGVGIGVNSNDVNWYTKKLYDKVLSHDYIHSVRDERTSEFLTKLGFKNLCTGCPTLWGITKELCDNIPSKKSENAVFTLTYYDTDVKNDRLMIDVLLRMYNKVYFWPQCIKDLEYLESFGFKEKIIIIPPNVEAYSTFLKANDCDYIGNRLHGGIFAIQHKKRAVIISIDYRAKEMNKTFTFECIERKNIGNLLYEKLNTSWYTAIKGIDFDLVNDWKKQFSYE